MTTLSLIIGIILITYSIIGTFCPTVSKNDLLLEEFDIPEDSNLEKNVEINSIVSVELCDSAPPKNQFEDCGFEVVTPIYTYYDVPLNDEIQQYIQDQCLEKFGTLELCGYNLPKLVINIIRWESGFNAENDNGKCCGLMSVTHNLWPGIVEDEQITNLIEPTNNLRAGIHILYNSFTEAWFDIFNEFIPFSKISDKDVTESDSHKLIIQSLNWYHTGKKISNDTTYSDNILSTYWNTMERDKQ